MSEEKPALNPDPQLPVPLAEAAAPPDSAPGRNLRLRRAQHNQAL